MKIVQDATINDLLVTLIRRISVSTESIEFMSQSAVVAQDAETMKVVGKNLSDIAYFNDSLADVWNRVIDVPLIVAPPPELVAGVQGLDPVPNIVWSTHATIPPVVTPYAGPTIQITVGQAIMALAILGDSHLPSSP